MSITIKLLSEKKSVGCFRQSKCFYQIEQIVEMECEKLIASNITSNYDLDLDPDYV